VEEGVALESYVWDLTGRAVYRLDDEVASQNTVENMDAKDQSSDPDGAFSEYVKSS